MRRCFRYSLLPQLLLAAAVGCSDDSTGPDDPGDPQDPGNNPPSAYVVRGAVTDATGQPLGGVAVIIDNTIYYNSAITGQTGNDGKYQITVTDGSWRALAQLQRAYNGRTYTFDLHPSDDDSFAGADGAVRNFTWKLTGAAPSYLGREYYGGQVDLLVDPNADTLSIENVEFTFVPVGPLVDGSAGQTLAGHPGAPNTDTYSKFVDVPMGRYRVSAVYAPAGEIPQPLKIRVEGADAYGDDTVADFLPDASVCENCMRLELNWP